MTRATEAAPIVEVLGQTAPNQFEHFAFRADENPALKEAAWTTHAEGYFKAGFTTEDAVDPETGWLPEDIDKTRRPNTDYFLAAEPGTNHYVATMRKMNLEPGQTYKDLPAYQVCGDRLSDFGRTHLEELQAAGVEIKEIVAMAGDSPVGVYEVMREAIHEALGKNEAWLFSIVNTTYDSLEGNWGKDSLLTIGDDTPLIDARVREGVALRPALFYPDKFNENLLKAYQNAEDPRAKKRYLRSFMFFSDGLTEEQMSFQVMQARQEILAAQAAGVSAEVVEAAVDTQKSVPSLTTLLAERAQSPDQWTQPPSFDLSREADRAEVQRKLVSGEITGVIDRIEEIAHELFEIENPSQKGNGALRQEYVQNILDQGETFGTWFHFPWSGRLVRYPDVEQHRALRTARNKNLITDAEQQKLYDAAIVVGGLSVGSNVVRELVTSGIGGTLILADPDHISATNLNRINGGLPDVGRSKIDHAAIQVSEADPYIKQVHMREGITAQNIKTVLEHNPTLIFDEVDHLPSKVAMRKFAQEHKVPLVMVTDAAERSIVDVERHDLGNAKPFDGRLSKELVDRIADGTAAPEELRKAMVKIVGLGNVSTKLLESFNEVGKELSGIPQLGSTASKGGALAASTARELILGGEVPSGRRVTDARKELGFRRETTLRDRARAIFALINSSRNQAA